MTHRSLERDLGLYAVITISVGAMIGSGIFVLPGLASKIAGPGVILAYLLAGLIVLPAALSQSEMATAMPEAGGTYLYVDRALGPMLGTIAGIGVWFSLVLKSAFALVGLGAYLLLFVNLPTKPVALGLALLVLAVNALGVKQTGRLQAVIVTGVLGVLLLFVLRGAAVVDASRYQPFLAHGVGGLLAATGFVFVSYAGVTKIASVAEEVRAPGRNIPAGILVSIALMMVVYTGLIYVVVGTSPAAQLHGTLTPMALAARDILGVGGEIIIAITAVLALTSMANAGVLSSSRYPFAMSRGELAPPLFQRVHPRFGTPVASIALTGAVLLALIAFVPVVDLAKLASAFQILVLCFVNLALIAFREGQVPSYRPTFRSPGYPWVQLGGIGAGLLLITQMGWLSVLGAAGIVIVGLVWFRVYGRPRTEREGVALAALRRNTDSTAVGHTRRALHTPGPLNLLLPVHPHMGRERERDLLRLAAMLAGPRDRLRVIRFDQVPEQVELLAMAAGPSAEDRAFETRVEERAGRARHAPVPGHRRRSRLEGGDRPPCARAPRRPGDHRRDPGSDPVAPVESRCGLADGPQRRRRGRARPTAPERHLRSAGDGHGRTLRRPEGRPGEPHRPQPGCAHPLHARGGRERPAGPTRHPAQLPRSARLALRRPHRERHPPRREPPFGTGRGLQERRSRHPGRDRPPLPRYPRRA